MFHSATEKVIAAAVPLHYHDPCGDNLTLITTMSMQGLGIKKIKAPVLVVCGSVTCSTRSSTAPTRPRATPRAAATRWSIIKGAGHALPIERHAKKFRRRLGRWLKHRGF